MREQGWRRFGWYVWDQGFGLPGDWQGRFAPSHEFVFHFNRKAEKPDKTQAKQEASIGIKNGKGMRRKDGTVQESLSSPDACLAATKIPDSVIRINRNSNMDAFARANHPATFPVAFPVFFQNAWPGCTYEPFCGSGTTLIAAEQLGRKCYGMEISPAYCDVIVKRWETLTGKKAQRA
jgi:DNA modification methylase